MKTPKNRNDKKIESTDKNLRYLAGFFDTLIQVDLAQKQKSPGVDKKKSSYNINAKDNKNDKK